MKTNISILRPGAYTQVWNVLNVLSKPSSQILLTYIEANPNCSTRNIHVNAGLQSSNPQRISQVLRELQNVGVVTVERDGNTNLVNINRDRIELINNSVARLI